MLKLTLYENDNRTIYISPRNIMAMWRSAGDLGTHVQIDHATHIVCERPEQIMAMPEMLHEMHPAFVINGGEHHTLRANPPAGTVMEPTFRR